MRDVPGAMRDAGYSEAQVKHAKGGRGHRGTVMHVCTACFQLLTMGHDTKAKNWVSSRADDHLRVCESITVDDAKAESARKKLEGDTARKEGKMSSLFATGASAAGHEHGSHKSPGSSVFRLHPNERCCFE